MFQFSGGATARIQVWVQVIIDRFRKRGLVWAIRGVGKRVLREAGWLLLLPLTLLLHLLGFRQILVRTEHIGHLCTQPDSFFKEQVLGMVPKRRYFMVAPAERVSNPHLLTYWGRKVRIISDPLAAAVLDVMSRRLLMRDDLSRYDAGFFGTQDIYRVNSLWGQRGPVLSLSDEDEAWSRKAFRELGIPEGAWFVCVHVREGGFLPHNELIQSHRNASVANAVPAMEEIIRRGGICVRMGDSTMTRMDFPGGVIDYAHHPLKSSRMDIALCAKARFFLGCTSGLAFLSMAFGVPVAHANMIPVETLGIRYCDLSIPKLLWAKSLNRHLRFREIMESDVGGYFFSHQYEAAGIRIDENAAGEIADLVEEMLERLSGNFVPTDEDRRLGAEYMGLFRPGHYSYGACSGVSTRFLRRHKSLLG